MISSRISVLASPKSVKEWGAELALNLGWYNSPSEALEAAEKWTPQVLSLLRRELDELNRLGRFATFTFNSSSLDLIQGAAFIEPCESVAVKTAKTKRAHFNSYLKALRQLTPREFERLCVGVLSLLGVKNAVLTPYSADEGVDFYGRLSLKGYIVPNAVFPGLQNQLSVWMVGQAKHYAVGKVSTPDVRDLVGAVTLAKGHAFGSYNDKYADLAIRVCDPVFYLFFTTSTLTSDAWTLLDRGGVVGMDGEMLAAFLADHDIGQTDGEFEAAAFVTWLATF
jgi:restriction endonuclease Mrr